MKDENTPLILSHHPKPQTINRRTFTTFSTKPIIHFILFIFLLSLIPSLILKPTVIKNQSSSSSSTPSNTYHQYPKTSSKSISPFEFPKHGLTFLVIGDWGRKGKHHQKEVAKSMSLVNHHLKKNLDFILSTGDNFYNRGIKNIYDPQWFTSYENIYLTEKHIQHLKWYTILGNHDHLGNIFAQIEYGKIKNNKWNMPFMYYTQLFQLKNEQAEDEEEILFVFLDTTPYVKDGYGKHARRKNKQKPKTQTKWLRNVLQKSKMNGIHKIVIVLHHQMYSMSIGGHFGTREIRAELEPILLKHRRRILAVISGHEHLLEHLQPYGGFNSWSGLASRFTTSSSLSEKNTEKRNKNSVMDYFVSGSGSRLDKLILPSKSRQNIWLDCCSILPLSKNSTQPRALFGERVHGFFIFSITNNHFYAKAYNEKGQIIYTYDKSI